MCEQVTIGSGLMTFNQESVRLKKWPRESLKAITKLRNAKPTQTRITLVKTTLVNNDVFVFRRSMDEGEIGILKFMGPDHTERCRIHLYVTFHLDL